MTNAYFAPTALTPRTVARAEAVNSEFAAVEAGFDALPTEAEIKQGKVTWGTDTGTAGACLVALPYAPASYVTGLEVAFKPAASCTGASTINVNSLGVKAIKRADGSSTVANDLLVGVPVALRYDGTYFRLMTSSAADVAAAAASAAAASASQSAASASASAASGSQTAAAGSAVAAAASAVAAAGSESAVAASASAASTSASTATTQATTATTQAGIATTQAGIATAAAGTATTQASTATTQAGTATTQAGIATTQAGIATTQASAAAASASDADASAIAAAASAAGLLTFSTIAVSGQSDVVADALGDTLTLASGTGITITTNAGTDTITITATADMKSDGSVAMTGDLQLGAGTGIIFEGTTADAYETTLTAGEPTADRSIALPDASGTLALTSDITPSSPAFKNLLINGGMEINQRLAATNADDTYALDRWNILTQTSTVAVTQLTDVENTTPYMMRITQSQASAQRFGAEQMIEAAVAKRYRGQAMALSARVRCSASTTLRYAILEWTGTADSVTSDVVNDWTSGTFTAGNFFLASNLTVTATGSTALTANALTSITALTGTLGSSGNNLIVLFWTDSTQAQNVTLDIGKVQLEAASAATAYEPVPADVTLSRCKRYFEKSYNLANSIAGAGDYTGIKVAYTYAVVPNTQAFDAVIFNQGKRTSATVTIYHPGTGTAAQVRDGATGTGYAVTASAGETSFYIANNSGGNLPSGTTMQFHWTAIAEL